MQSKSPSSIQSSTILCTYVQHAHVTAMSSPLRVEKITN